MKLQIGTNRCLHICLAIFVFASIVFLTLYVNTRNRLKLLLASTEAPTRTVSSGATTSHLSLGPGPWEQYRLPTNVRPTEYNVHLTIHVEQGWFNGSSSIKVDVNTPTDTIILHTRHHQILSINLDRAGDNIPITFFPFPKNEFLVIETKPRLNVSQYVLSMTFSSLLSNSTSGVYRSTYKTRDSTSHYIVSTQFQPIEARHAFPCFDEPSFKANFTLRITHQSKFKALGNTPGVSTQLGDNWTSTQFEPTVVMPVYLVAFAIGEFESIEGDISKNGVILTYYSQMEMKIGLKFASSVGTRVLDIMVALYNQTYPMKKADMIQIPNSDIVAMENWGLITYMDTALIVDEDLATDANRDFVLSVIVHELAHQWFGNLVTADWWENIWLNEGFANFMEWYVMDLMFKDRKYRDVLFYNEKNSAMKADSSITSRSVRYPVSSESQVRDMFSAVTYSKGSSVIMMLEEYIGTKVLINGLRTYLEEMKYKNANTEDLWRHISMASNQSIGLIMDTWTAQMGHPYVNVTMSGDTVTLYQEQFLTVPNNNVSVFRARSLRFFDQLWAIPIKYQVYTQSNGVWQTEGSTQNLVMSGRSLTFSLSTGTRPVLLLLNVGQTGFYRVNYMGLLGNFSDALRSNSIRLSAVDKAGMIMDSFALALAGKGSYTSALDLFDFLSNETEYHPWEAALGELRSLRTLVNPSGTTYDLLVNYMKNLLRPTFGHDFKDLLYNHTLDRLATRLRSMRIAAACEFGLELCESYMKDLFSRMKAGNKIPANLKSMLYIEVIKRGSDVQWKYLFDLYRNCTYTPERLRLLKGLASSKSPFLLERLLRYSLEEKHIRVQDIPHLFSYMASDCPTGTFAAWQFFKNNINNLQKIKSGSTFSIDRLMSAVIEPMYLREEAEDVEHLLYQRPDLSELKPFLHQLRERIAFRERWAANSEADILAWLREKHSLQQ